MAENIRKKEKPDSLKDFFFTNLKKETSEILLYKKKPPKYFSIKRKLRKKSQKAFKRKIAFKDTEIEKKGKVEEYL